MKKVQWLHLSLKSLFVESTKDQTDENTIGHLLSCYVLLSIFLQVPADVGRILHLLCSQIVNQNFQKKTKENITTERTPQKVQSLRPFQRFSCHRKSCTGLSKRNGAKLRESVQLQCPVPNCSQPQPATPGWCLAKQCLFCTSLYICQNGQWKCNHTVLNCTWGCRSRS